jgi:hypothetical protein
MLTFFSPPHKDPAKIMALDVKSASSRDIRNPLSTQTDEACHDC